MKNFLAYTIFWFLKLLNKPFSVLVISLSLASASLIFQRTFIQIWQLNRDYRDLDSKIEKIKKETVYYESQIKKISDPNQLELEVIDRFDLAQKGDLIFLFPESEN